MTTRTQILKRAPLVALAAAASIPAMIVCGGGRTPLVNKDILSALRTRTDLRAGSAAPAPTDPHRPETPPPREPPTPNPIRSELERATVLKYFQALGERIEREWRRADFSSGAFSRICSEALQAMPGHRSVRTGDVVLWGLTAPRLPEQQDPDALFGEPPITTWSGEGFFIAVNFWLTSTTAIHNHGFSGAFQVLSGSSLQTSFRFEPKRVVNAHMAIGVLDETVREVLAPGDTREIRAGETIHSLFHLEHPSATIVVRTGRDATAPPQLSYHRPNLAMDPRFNPANLVRRKQLFRFLGKTEPRRLSASCLRSLKGADLVTRVEGLRLCAALLSPEEGDALLERARRMDPTTATLVAGVIEGDRREVRLIRRRQCVTDPDLRFFLAVLLNVRGRKEALALIASRFPAGDPVVTVLGWIRGLAALPGGFGESALGFPIDDVVLTVIEGALRGHDAARVARRAGAVAGRPLTRSDTRDLASLRVAIEQSEIFRYLLQ